MSPQPCCPQNVRSSRLRVIRSDPQSLTLKYSAAKELGLRGVGPYTYSDLAYGTPQEKAEAQAMWDALHAFTGP